MKTLTEKQNQELAGLVQLRDVDIDTSDIPEVNDWSRAVVGKFYRPIKEQVSLRLDVDVLAWLRSKGRGYQTRINTLLRQSMTESSSREKRHGGGGEAEVRTAESTRASCSNVSASSAPVRASRRRRPSSVR